MTRTCPKCQRKFNTYNGYQDHCSVKHIYCYDCDKLFGDNDGLEMHNVEAHGYCLICDKDFGNRNKLDTHIERKHLFCRYCNEVLKDDVDKVDHFVDEHDGCWLCERAFPQGGPAALHQHNITVHEDRYCKECRKVFGEYYAYKRVSILSSYQALHILLIYNVRDIGHSCQHLRGPAHS